MGRSVGALPGRLPGLPAADRFDTLGAVPISKRFSWSGVRHPPLRRSRPGARPRAGSCVPPRRWPFPEAPDAIVHPTVHFAFYPADGTRVGQDDPGREIACFFQPPNRRIRQPGLLSDRRLPNNIAGHATSRVSNDAKSVATSCASVTPCNAHMCTGTCPTPAHLPAGCSTELVFKGDSCQSRAAAGCARYQLSLFSSRQPRQLGAVFPNPRFRPHGLHAVARRFRLDQDCRRPGAVNQNALDQGCGRGGCRGCRPIGGKDAPPIPVNFDGPPIQRDAADQACGPQLARNQLFKGPDACRGFYRSSSLPIPASRERPTPARDPKFPAQSQDCAFLAMPVWIGQAAECEHRIGERQPGV